MSRSDNYGPSSSPEMVVIQKAEGGSLFFDEHQCPCRSLGDRLTGKGRPPTTDGAATCLLILPFLSPLLLHFAKISLLIPCTCDNPVNDIAVFRIPSALKQNLNTNLSCNRCFARTPTPRKTCICWNMLGFGGNMPLNPLNDHAYPHFTNPWCPSSDPLASREPSTTNPNLIRSLNVESVGKYSPLSKIFVLIETDMNDPEALKIYGELLLFREDLSLAELLVDDPSHWKQGALCRAAQLLNLEYEYRLSVKQAKISRPCNVQKPEEDTVMIEPQPLEPLPAWGMKAMGPQDNDEYVRSSFPNPWDGLADNSCSPLYSNPFSYSAASISSSLSEYSAAGSDMEAFSSRTLPRPSRLLNGSVIAAPQSMMGQFSSKVSSSTQKKCKCRVCGKSFIRPSSLQAHIYSHSGEKRRILCSDNEMNVL
jgi:hypothetical protein